MPVAQEQLLQHLGQRRVIKLPVQDRFHLGVAPFHGVADDHDFGVGGNVLGAIPGVEHDARAFQKGGHRRINVFVRTGDGEAAFPQRRRHRSHGGAADPDEMKISGRADHAVSLRRAKRFG
jgi:hypothetical protein